MASKELIREIIDDEGSRSEAYRDNLGYWTIGVGHRIRQNDDEKWMMGAILLPEQEEEILSKDLEIAENDAIALINNFILLPREARRVIINMSFNLGYNRLLTFKKFIRAVENHDWKTAAEEMKDSRWFHQVPLRANRLAERIRKLST